jgi:hypothetical protein
MVLVGCGSLKTIIQCRFMNSYRVKIFESW